MSHAALLVATEIEKRTVGLPFGPKKSTRVKVKQKKGVVFPLIPNSAKKKAVPTAKAEGRVSV